MTAHLSVVSQSMEYESDENVCAGRGYKPLWESTVFVFDMIRVFCGKHKRHLYRRSLCLICEKKLLT